MGCTLHHDDSLSDRTQGGILDQSYQSTKQLWYEQFGEEYLVAGGMYRGEPPESFFDTNWKNLNTPISMPSELLEMGALSTSPTEGPTKWANIKSRTSDGSPAFMYPSKGYVTHQKKLQKEVYKKNYILGKHKKRTGYFHIETREAHEIMLLRIISKLERLESDIAMEQSCCGDNDSKYIACKGAEIKATKGVYIEISKRAKAAKPKAMGASDNSSSAFVNSSGAWLYPTSVWTSCGGACGGSVVCSADVGGASACGGSGGGDYGGSWGGGGGGGDSGGGGGCDSGGGGGGGDSGGSGGC